MANVPPPKGKGEPPPPADIVGNLDKPEPEEISNLNFKVPKSFHRELGILYLNYARKSLRRRLFVGAA